MRVFKQTNIGKQWGMIAQIMSQASIFLSLVNLLLLAVTAYNTTIAGWLMARGIYLRFWVFVVIIIGGLAVSAMLLWKYALPSFYSAFNDQFYRHDNELRKDIENIQSTLNQINNRLEVLEKK